MVYECHGMKGNQEWIYGVVRTVEICIINAYSIEGCKRHFFIFHSPVFGDSDILNVR